MSIEKAPQSDSKTNREKFDDIRSPSNSFGCFDSQRLKFPAPKSVNEKLVNLVWYPNNPKPKEEMNEKAVWKGIKEFYSHQSPLVKLLGSLLNCYFTHAQGSFLCSYKILMRMIKDDPNLSISEKDLEGYEPADIMRFLVDPQDSGHSFFRQVGDEREGVASVLSLDEPELVAAMEAGVSREVMGKQELELVRVQREYQEKRNEN